MRTYATIRPATLIGLGVVAVAILVLIASLRCSQGTPRRQTGVAPWNIRIDAGDELTRLLATNHLPLITISRMGRLSMRDGGPDEPFVSVAVWETGRIIVYTHDPAPVVTELYVSAKDAKRWAMRIVGGHGADTSKLRRDGVPQDTRTASIAVRLDGDDIFKAWMLAEDLPLGAEPRQILWRQWLERMDAADSSDPVSIPGPDVAWHRFEQYGLPWWVEFMRSYRSAERNERR
jgi:hypothetical protein